MKAYIILAQGFETIEALTPADLMSRAKIEYQTISLDNNKQVRSSHGIKVIADATFDETNFNDGDMIILPGGYPGYENLAKSEKLGKIIKQYEKEDKFIASICGGPLVLLKNGIKKDSTITCHRCIKEEMKSTYNYTGKPLEVDGKIITAIGAGHALDFSMQIVSSLTNEEKANNLKNGLEL